MSETKSRCRSWSGWTVLMVAGVSYPLSMGPVVWLVENRMVSASTIDQLERFYFPLTFVCNRFPKIQDLAEAYINLWQV